MRPRLGVDYGPDSEVLVIFFWDSSRCILRALRKRSKVRKSLQKEPCQSDTVVETVASHKCPVCWQESEGFKLAGLPDLPFLRAPRPAQRSGRGP